MVNSPAILQKSILLKCINLCRGSVTSCDYDLSKAALYLLTVIANLCKGFYTNTNSKLKKIK